MPNRTGITKPSGAAAGPGRSGSQSWFWATALQGAVTAALLALCWYAHGKSWERHAQVIVLIGIVATWGLALRTIRARLVELLRQWQRYSKGLARRASASGKHLLQPPGSEPQEQYIKTSIWRLRIIAAGLTIPFFVMPMFFAFFAAAFCVCVATGADKDSWCAAASASVLAAAIVAGYFHWVILPKPAPVLIPVRMRRIFPPHVRRRSIW